MSKNTHFWFSAQQKTHLQQIALHQHASYTPKMAVIKNQQVEYTACNSTSKVSGIAFKDAQYLGKGTIKSK